MSHLTNVELDGLRHLIGSCSVKAKKFRAYSQQCRNADLKNWCDREAGMAEQSRQQLLSFLTEEAGVQ